MHVSLGRPWHGRPTKKGCIAYIVGEGAAGFGARLRVLEKGNRSPCFPELV
jgi:hypothetical protein